MPPIPRASPNFPNRGFHPLTPGPNANEVRGILKKHYPNCLGISENGLAIEGIHFQPIGNVDGCQGVEALLGHVKT